MTEFIDNPGPNPKKQDCELECLETKTDGKGAGKTRKFKWVTNCKITRNYTASKIFYFLLQIAHMLAQRRNDKEGFFRYS